MGQSESKYDLIDSFRPTLFDKVYNEYNREDEWDLDESGVGMTKHDGFIVRGNQKFRDIVANILSLSMELIHYMKMYFCDKLDVESFGRYYSGMYLFVVTPHTLQEMSMFDKYPRVDDYGNLDYNDYMIFKKKRNSDNRFNGLNKPKRIVYVDPYNGEWKGCTYDKDNNLRASSRHILLKITKKGKLTSYKEYINLLVHELAHTMCNHVIYREEGNHLNDFKMYENLLKGVINNPKGNNNLVEIKKILDKLKKCFN